MLGVSEQMCLPVKQLTDPIPTIMTWCWWRGCWPMQQHLLLISTMTNKTGSDRHKDTLRSHSAVWHTQHQYCLLWHITTNNECCFFQCVSLWREVTMMLCRVPSCLIFQTGSFADDCVITTNHISAVHVSIQETRDQFSLNSVSVNRQQVWWGFWISPSQTIDLLITACYQCFTAV